QANGRGAGEQGKGQYGRARSLQLANNCKLITYGLFLKSAWQRTTRFSDPFCNKSGSQNPVNSALNNTLPILCWYVRRMDTLIHFGTLSNRPRTFALTVYLSAICDLDPTVAGTLRGRWR